MRVQASPKYLAAFAALTLVLSELHEQAHITLGRIVCGGYGPRDFNVWTTCEGCCRPSLAFLSSIGGPAFSYAVMAVGLWLLRHSSPTRRALGLALVFGPLPFARIFTALTGGGDEITLLRALFGDDLGRPALWAIGAAIVAALCVPPLVVAFRSLESKGRGPVFPSFLLGPMLFSFVWSHKLMNGVLDAGVLDRVVILGTPTLILVHAMVAAVVLAVFGRELVSGPRPRQA